MFKDEISLIYILLRGVFVFTPLVSILFHRVFSWQNFANIWCRNFTQNKQQLATGLLKKR